MDSLDFFSTQTDSATLHPQPDFLPTSAAVTYASSSTSSAATPSVSSFVAPPSAHQSLTNVKNTKKATQSPKPSILRKREAGDHQGHEGGSGPQPVLNPRSKFNSTSSSKGNYGFVGVGKVSGGGVATASNILILKDFQPPVEETSCQSVCSDSTSGSSTISTTSETAEWQLQQKRLFGSVEVNLASPFAGLGLGSSCDPENSAATTSGSSGQFNKKEDANSGSARKKPRKQQL